MQVNVLLEDKQSLALDFGADDTIQHVKMKIEEEEDIPQVMQRVIFAGVTQMDGQLLTALAPGPLITLSVVASDTIYNVIVVNHNGKRHNVVCGMRYAVCATAWALALQLARTSVLHAKEALVFASCATARQHSWRPSR